MPSQRRQFSILRFLGVLFLASLTLCLCLGHVSSTAWQVGLGAVVTAQAPNASQLVQQGVERYRKGNFQGAIELWLDALKLYQDTNSRANEVIVLENLAKAYQRLGQNEQALSNWDKVIVYYRQTNDLLKVGRILTEQAQIYSNLGQSRRAIALLLCGEVNFEKRTSSEQEPDCIQEGALQIARTHQDREGEAAALGSLGEAYHLRGKYKQAIEALEDSLKIAEEIDARSYRSLALNSLGNVYISFAQVNYRRAKSADQLGDSGDADQLMQKALSDDSTALKYFQDSLEFARQQNDQSSQIRALLNSIPPYYRTNASASAVEAWQQARSLLESLPDTPGKVYTTINLAHLLQPVTLSDEASSKVRCFKPELELKAQELLEKAVSIAQSLKDSRSESFALGELGHVYECRQEYQQALDLTQQARWAADQHQLAKDSLYLWDWQAARIYMTLRRESEAIAAYERAIATLDDIRDDILIADQDLQFDFRDAIEPLYREFAELRLERASLSSIKPDTLEQDLDSALKTIDSLRLAELQNYFGDNCILIPADKEKTIDLTATAVFRSIILNQRTAVIVSFPNGQEKLNWIDSDSKSLEEEINKFRIKLERFFDDYNPQQTQKVYDWLIRPFASDLEQAQIKTLVFIQDGVLRSIPMAALYDGEKFLIEKYAIATTPSLKVTDAKALNRQRLRALVLGLTQPAKVEGRPPFPALANVEAEVRKIQELLSGSKLLLNPNFNRERLQQELTKAVFPIIHIATHGEFGTEPENTFLVTGNIVQGNNEKLTINELDKVIRDVARGTEQVELLTLTACETAIGDARAALGLAGVAVQAGAKSAVASLWSIADQPTVEVATKFYGDLRNPSVSKAEALRAAQLRLLKGEVGKEYTHPAYWAPFILIGNWL